MPHEVSSESAPKKKWGGGDGKSISWFLTYVESKFLENSFPVKRIVLTYGCF